MIFWRHLLLLLIVAILVAEIKTAAAQTTGSTFCIHPSVKVYPYRPPLRSKSTMDDDYVDA